MNELVAHVEFLLHDHNCVIIPGFGGFVVNSSPARRDGIATFRPPSCELVFNRDLTHNDGLLAQSYMKSEGIHFETAMNRIELAMEELKRLLRDERQVDLGNLGYFAMNDESRFVYKPAAFVQPTYFGLTVASLKPLIQMQPPGTTTQGKPGPRYRSVGIAAAAAVILLLMMFLLPVSDRSFVRQSAQIISETDFFGSPPRTGNSEENASETATVDETATVEMLPEQPVREAERPDVTASNTANMPRYYIIVGVYEVNDVAEKMMEKLLDGGFPERGWMKRSGRIDVYAASFTEREEAESTLRKMHKDYPAYGDAWILKR